MSTHPRSRSNARRPYDISPSPTLVGSPSSSASASTVSLPRFNTAGPQSTYGQRAGPGEGTRQDPAPESDYGYTYRQKAGDSRDAAAKISIFVGIVAVFAGIMHLRKSKRNRELARRREEYERRQKSQRRTAERNRAAREQSQRDWDNWREQSTRHRIQGYERGYSRQIEYPYDGGSRNGRYSGSRT